MNNDLHAGDVNEPLPPLKTVLTIRVVLAEGREISVPQMGRLQKQVDTLMMAQGAMPLSVGIAQNREVA